MLVQPPLGLPHKRPQGLRAHLRVLVYRLWDATCYWGKFRNIPPLEFALRRAHYALGGLLDVL